MYTFPMSPALCVSAWLAAPHATPSSQPRRSHAVTRLASAKPLRGTSRSRMPRSREKAVESMPQHTHPEMAVYQEEDVRCGISSNKWRAASGAVRWRK